MASTRARARSLKDQETERCREAAELAIEQLDWCISYLRQIRKPRIARALQANRETIVKRYGL
jgi:hypothetical protein